MKLRLVALFSLLSILAAGRAARAANTSPAAPVGLEPSAAAQGTNRAAPRIQFAEAEYDFGRVVAGQVGKHIFEFTNTGTGLLLVRDARSTCGCTTANNWTRQVEPGKSGQIAIEFHSSKFTGPITKEVTVTSNDAERREVTLKVKATVWRAFELEPGTAGFSATADALTNLIRTVRIINKQTVPLTLSEPQSSQRVFVSELRTNQLGQEYQLVVKLVPPLGAGNVFGEVTMKTSSSEMPLLTVPVWVVAQPPVMVLPAQLRLPASPLPEPVTQTIAFRNNWTQPLAVSEPATNAKGVELSLTEIEAGRYFGLNVTFPRGFDLRGDSLEVTVKSNHPNFPVIRIPIIQRASAAGKGVVPVSVSQNK